MTYTNKGMNPQHFWEWSGGHPNLNQFGNPDSDPRSLSVEATSGDEVHLALADILTALTSAKAKCTSPSLSGFFNFALHRSPYAVFSEILMLENSVGEMIVTGQWRSYYSHHVCIVHCLWNIFSEKREFLIFHGMDTWRRHWGDPIGI